jgi:hypothetical protein
MLHVQADFISGDFFFLGLKFTPLFQIYAIIFSLMQFGIDERQYFSVLCDLA